MKQPTRRGRHLGPLLLALVLGGASVQPALLLAASTSAPTHSPSSLERVYLVYAQPRSSDRPADLMGGALGGLGLLALTAVRRRNLRAGPR